MLKSLTMQEAADRLSAVVVKEITCDGIRVFAYPVAQLLPACIACGRGVSWSVRRTRRNITDSLLTADVLKHNAHVPVLPRSIAKLNSRLISAK